MTYEEAFREVTELRGRFNAPYSSSDKRRIGELYIAVLGRSIPPTSCQDCYRDALLEIYSRLKKTRVMASELNYRLRAGFIIYSPIFHKGTIFSNDNLTDGVAREYLEMFPDNTFMFQKLPEMAALSKATGAAEAKKTATGDETGKKAAAGKGNRK